MSKPVSSSIASVTCYEVALATYVYMALMCKFSVYPIVFRVFNR
ncbi:hypothetical protein F383_35889 [Gossypium arboreum]|uniref:Uncharacterized protein n=1 Tax=Gossypium arboreum TaxID=29729 RepID=A0A0B0PRU0_GOSAR|nr:hypothetical protein F383_35889 [Gossypium arboreum]